MNPIYNPKGLMLREILPSKVESLKENNPLGYRLLTEIKRLGFTQAKFAKKFDIAQTTLSGIINFGKKPTSKTLEKINQAGVDLTWLLTGEKFKLNLSYTATPINLPMVSRLNEDHPQRALEPVYKETKFESAAANEIWTVYVSRTKKAIGDWERAMQRNAAEPGQVFEVKNIKAELLASVISLIHKLEKDDLQLLKSIIDNELEDKFEHPAG